MELSEEGASLIKQHEGYRLDAYQDVVGIWTIGYGATEGVQEGDVWTQEEADDNFNEDVQKYEECVSSMVVVDLTQGQFDALVSFAYNLGCKALMGSTLLRLLNAGDVQGAANEFLKWDRAGGRVIEGLLERRQDEQQLFLS